MENNNYFDNIFDRFIVYIDINDDNSKDKDN